MGNVLFGHEREKCENTNDCFENVDSIVQIVRH